MTMPARMLLESFTDLAAVDTACHLGQWPHRLSSRTDANDLRVYAERLGLRSVWVSHVSALFGFDTHEANQAALSECADDPLFRVFAVINPHEDGWRAELAWAATQGFSGVRLTPGFHLYPALDCAPVIAASTELGLPIQLLARTDDARVRHPHSPVADVPMTDLADLVRDLPPHPFVLSGLNWADYLELCHEVGGTLAPNISLDYWHVNGPTGVIDRLAAEPSRWLFGSGYPVQTPEASMLQLTASALTPEMQRKVASGNAQLIVPAPLSR